MRIHSLTAFQTPVALRKPIRHASHTRTRNETLIVRCELNDGSVGWGEGLPRPYVTGESIDTVWRHLTSTRFERLADSDFDTPQAAHAHFGELRLADVRPDSDVEPRECFGNAVRCAIEVALIDAACRSAGCSVGDFVGAIATGLGLADRKDSVRYSGVVTSGSAVSQWRSALKMRLFNFQQIKVKVGTQGVDDTTLLKRLRLAAGRHVDLRADANEAWQPDQVLDRVGALAGFRLTSLEQPVPHAHVGALKDLRPDIQIPIMLDESLCSLHDAERAIADGTCDLFNLRLSKCGGLVKCLELAGIAQENGLGYQLGCQVGETGILSAAGRHFACNVAGLQYLEGSYDRFLVRDSLTEQDLTFGFGGHANSIPGRGLGVTVNEAAIRRKSVRTESLIYG